MNAVILSFNPNKKQSVSCERKQLNVRAAVESDSVKSARKAKSKLHMACERVSETRERTLHGQEQNRMCMASMRESRDSDRFQHTSTITYTAAPRVWYFSAFHYSCNTTALCESLSAQERIRFFLPVSLGLGIMYYLI